MMNFLKEWLNEPNHFGYPVKMAYEALKDKFKDSTDFSKFTQSGMYKAFSKRSKYSWKRI